MAIGRSIRWKERLPGLCCAVAILALWASSSSAVAQSYQDLIDYTKLKWQAGSDLPNGAGNIISFVEGQLSGASWINTGSNEFNGVADPTGTPVSLTDMSGSAGAGVSTHANGVAFYLFGDQTSIADGANQVVHYEAGHWLANGALHYETSGGTDNNAQPEPQNFKVQNHSWILATLGNASQDQSALRRADWTIETGDMTMVVGANNAGTLVAHPNLLVHSFNAIVVGRTDGFHSRGATGAVYGSGRYRPDIVAPMTLTSHATPVVGAAASLLHEAVAGTDGSRSEVMKAMLMAGATKQEFTAFDDPFVAGPAINAWDHTPTRPLDDIFGAGELNVYNSYLMTVGGQHAGSTSPPTTTAATHGWDYQNRKSDSAVDDIFYQFEVPVGSTASELSIILAWNAKITDTNAAPGVFTPVETLQNLDLAFYNSAGGLIDHSISTVDNVEHIYRTGLTPGTYTLKVSNAASWDYGLAWRMATQFDQVSADFDEDGDVDGSDFLTWQTGYGKLVGATHAQGDADGDGDIDGDDYAAVNNKVMPTPPPGLALEEPGASAIPEPSTLALAAGGLLAAAGWTWRRNRRG